MLCGKEAREDDATDSISGISGDWLGIHAVAFKEAAAAEAYEGADAAEGVDDDVAAMTEFCVLVFGGVRLGLGSRS